MTVQYNIYIYIFKLLLVSSEADLSFLVINNNNDNNDTNIMLNYFVFS